MNSNTLIPPCGGQTSSQQPAVPQFAQMHLGYRENADGATVAHDTTLVDDAAGDLHVVLRSVKALLVAAGFDWVVSVAAETEGGQVIFSDDI